MDDLEPKLEETVDSSSTSHSGDKTGRLLVIAIVILVISGLFAYYFLVTDNGRAMLFGNPIRKTFTFSDDYKKADSLHKSGDIDTAIPLLEKIVENNSNIVEKTKAKLILAFDLYSRNEGSDRLDSVKLYSEIINDKDVPAGLKSAAISDLMGQYYGTRDADYFKNTILSVEPFAKIGRESKNLVFAERKMLEFGESFAPNAMLEFRIAQWYGRVLQTTDLKSDVVDDYTKKLSSWTKKGEANIKDLLPDLETSQKVTLYQMNALARKQMGNFPESEEAFIKAIEILDGTEDLYAYGIGLYTRFFYAVLLSNEKYGGSRNDEIKKILEPLVNTPVKFENNKFPFFADFMKYESGGVRKGISYYNDIKNLIKIYPQFGEKLRQQGINF
jgi:tetratricopeptide (TPR) repeat protein